MKDYQKAGTALGFMFLMGAFCGYMLVRDSLNPAWRNEAIKRGFAEYNSTNGNWQWKERVTMTNYATAIRYVTETNYIGVIRSEDFLVTETNIWTDLLHRPTTNSLEIKTNYGLGGVITLNGGER